MNIELKQAAQRALLALRNSQPRPSSPFIGLTDRDFIDHEETIRQLRNALQQPAQAVNEKHFGDFELLVVTTAYEQGFGHAFRTELSNPYAPTTNAYKAWDMGRSAGKRKGQPQQPATPEPTVPQEHEAYSRYLDAATPELVPMTDDQVWHNDALMSANGIAGFKMGALMRIVRAVEAHHFGVIAKNGGA